MNSFEQIGEARLAAFEGQRQIAAAAGRGLARALGRLIKLLDRRVPQDTIATW